MKIQDEDSSADDSRNAGTSAGKSRDRDCTDYTEDGHVTKSNQYIGEGSFVEEDDEEEEEFFQDVAFRCLSTIQWPRSWAIKILLFPYFETASISIILLNCITLGLYDPFDQKCVTQRCQVLEAMEMTIYFFFLIELLIKMLAFGLTGPLGYFKDPWNKMDFFIVVAGTFEILYGDGEFLSSIRAIRVLRPLRAINRVPSIRILVTLLLDTLPMLGNVLAICMLIFAVFGIIGVQLWQGVLRNRCFLELPINATGYPSNLTEYYYSRLKWTNLCSLPSENGLGHCSSGFIPPYSVNGTVCTKRFGDVNSSGCTDWNSYYTSCEQRAENPYYGITSFDHFGLAFIAIFQVITLEGWSQVMYFLQDSYSPWVWIYFIILIVLGSYFMTNLCLVVIATQFSETRQRESALIEAAMKKSRMMKSHSTITSSDMSQASKQGCYGAMLGYAAQQIRRVKRRLRKRLQAAGILKPKIKTKSKVKTRRRATNTIHLHHHHHHHIHHHHHHSCAANDPASSSSSGMEMSLSPTILPGGLERPSVSYPQPPQATTKALLHIEPLGGGRDMRIESPLASRNAALLLPEATVVLCTSKSASARASPSTHTVSFFSASYNSPGAADKKKPCTTNQCQKPLAVTSKVQMPNMFCSADCPFITGGMGAGGKAAEYEYHYESQDSDDDDSESPAVKPCTRLQKILQAACDHEVFKGIIMGAILMNTLTMAVEHHNQPALLSQILDVMND